MYQQSVIEFKILWDWELYSIIIVWCDWYCFIFGVFYVFKGKVNVVLWCYQFKVVVNGEFIFYCYCCEVFFVFIGKFINKLLVVRN